MDELNSNELIDLLAQDNKEIIEKLNHINNIVGAVNRLNNWLLGIPVATLILIISTSNNFYLEETFYWENMYLFIIKFNLTVVLVFGIFKFKNLNIDIQMQLTSFTLEKNIEEYRKGIENLKEQISNNVAERGDKVLNNTDYENMDNSIEVLSNKYRKESRTRFDGIIRKQFQLVWYSSIYLYIYSFSILPFVLFLYYFLDYHFQVSANLYLKLIWTQQLLF